MHSSSNRTCSDRTSATLRATVITGSGSEIRRPPRPTTATAQSYTRPAPPSRVILPDRSPQQRHVRATRLVGLGRSPVRYLAGQADANGSVRRLDISLDRFRETQIALLLAICESRMPLVVRGLWGPPRSVGMRGRGGAGECGQVPRIVRALLAF